MKYLFVLDFEDGKVYRYDVRGVSKEHEEYLLEQGHSLSNIEWMVTDIGKLYTYMDAD
tara:strand:+ start:410 stop:583 length:174 start_codon:yes stop_codon:yes gene_type:complete